jgi:MoaA/NifB/PqqE/SkfB family radical SAM enzyme
MERLPVRSVNLGTGENGMHPDFKSILAYLRKRPIKLTITSNGHSVAVLDDDELRAFHDVEFSLDYPTQAEQDAQRGNGNWELIHRQAGRCVRLGVPVTIIAVMMKANYLRLAEVAQAAKQFDAPLRVNVYQAVRSDVYALSYEEYWEGFRRLFAETDVIAIGEPLVRAMAGLPPLRGGCGVSTVRVTPRATTQPCVYWPGLGEPLKDLISWPFTRLAHFQTRASLVSSETHAMVAVLDADASRTRCWSLTATVRSFAGIIAVCRSAWPQPAICPS